MSNEPSWEEVKKVFADEELDVDLMIQFGKITKERAIEVAKATIKAKGENE